MNQYMITYADHFTTQIAAPTPEAASYQANLMRPGMGIVRLVLLVNNT